MAYQATTSALSTEVLGDHDLVEASGLARLRDLRVRSWLAECRAALNAASDADESAEERADR